MVNGEWYIFFFSFFLVGGGFPCFSWFLLCFSSKTFIVTKWIYTKTSPSSSLLLVYSIVEGIKLVDKIGLSFFSVVSIILLYLLYYSELHVCHAEAWLVPVSPCGFAGNLVLDVAPVVGYAKLQLFSCLSSVYFMAVIFGTLYHIYAIK